jgi:hypothetical protein
MTGPAGIPGSRPPGRSGRRSSSSMARPWCSASTASPTSIPALPQARPRSPALRLRLPGARRGRSVPAAATPAQDQPSATAPRASRGNLRGAIRAGRDRAGAVRGCLPHGARGFGLQASRARLPARPLRPLAQGQEPAAPGLQPRRGPVPRSANRKPATSAALT